MFLEILIIISLIRSHHLSTSFLVGLHHFCNKRESQIQASDAPEGFQSMVVGGNDFQEWSLAAFATQ